MWAEIIKTVGMSLTGHCNAGTTTSTQKGLYSKFKMCWNVLVITLLIYSCIYVPMQVAFLDFDSEVSGVSKMLQTID